MKLDKWDNLLIRACKGRGDTIRRLRKIWRKRCLLPDGYNVDSGVIYHLLTLLNNRKKGLEFREWVEILDRSNPDSSINKLWEMKGYNDCLFNAVIGKISITAVAEWEGYIEPAYFRNKKLTSV